MSCAFARFITPAVLISCLVPAIAAERGRSFAGTYQLSSVTKSEDSVQVTVTVSLRNFSGADIHGGSVILFDSSANPSVLGKFSSIKLFENSHVLKISHVFSIPNEEYVLWLKGRNPVLRFQLPETTDPAMAEAIDLQQVSTVNPGTN
jgi:hypothetical protein